MELKKKGKQQFLKFPIFLYGMVTGIKANQCKEEIRKNLIKFKLEAKDVLADAFFGKRKTNKFPTDDWVFDRITGNVEKAKEIENQIEILINKLNPLYEERVGVAVLKKRMVNSYP